MKPMTTYLNMATFVVLSSFFWNGCYTQLAINPDEPETITASPTIIYISDPTPPIYIYEPPIYNTPPTPSYPSSPTAGTTYQTPAPKETRDYGVQRSTSNDQSNTQRTESSPSRDSQSNTTGRTIGSRRGG